MDLSLIYFGVVLPVAVIAAVYYIVRFRRKYRTQMRNYKADEIAQRVDYDIYPDGPSNPHDPANRRDTGAL